MREREYIDWLRGTLASEYIGDDCAVVKVEDAELLFTTDLLVEGTHFGSDTPAELVGRKAVGAALSDISAMAGVPMYVVLSVAFRRGGDDERCRELFLGARDVAREFDVDIVGGDTTSAEGASCVCVSAVGRVGEKGVVSRAGAREGDVVLVTGTLGGSLRWKHLRFVPRVREVREIVSAAQPSAMIDITDGLSTDLGYIAEESGVGAVIFEDRIPVSEDAEKISEKDGRSPLDHALHDGEDFELLMTASRDDANRILALDIGCGITEIGRIGGTDLRIAKPDGSETRLDPLGYEHNW